MSRPSPGATRRRWLMTAAAAPLITGALGLALLTGPAPSAGAADATTTTTTTTTTPTTTAPTTTATTPTTTAPTTTAPTTTTPTTTKATATSSGGSAAGWIVLAVVLALAVVLLIVLLVRRRGRTRAESQWRPSARSALGSARLTQSLLAAAAPELDDAAHRAELNQRVQEAALQLERVAASAPDDEAKAAATASADALRAVGFAVEGLRLLRDGGRVPTGDELARADQLQRSRQAELEAALARLGQQVGQSGPGSG